MGGMKTKWPQFSLRRLFATTALFAVAVLCAKAAMTSESGMGSNGPSLLFIASMFVLGASVGVPFRRPIVFGLAFLVILQVFYLWNLWYCGQLLLRAGQAHRAPTAQSVP
jgi:hypothetical protein